MYSRFIRFGEFTWAILTITIVILCYSTKLSQLCSSNFHEECCMMFVKIKTDLSETDKEYGVVIFYNFPPYIYRGDIV
jgi:hypothetical protein